MIWNKLVWLYRKIFKSYNTKQLEKLQCQIENINFISADYEKMDDEALRACTAKLIFRLENGETLEDIRDEAFAVVREAADRRLGMLKVLRLTSEELDIFEDENLISQIKDIKNRIYDEHLKTSDLMLKNDFYEKMRKTELPQFRYRPFDVQLIGGIVLHQGKIAEMRTGEGKTLVATMPVYLNALTRKGVHVITVNDYLAQRDATWMGEIYRFLGLSVGVILNDMDQEDRKAAYQCDITYGTNNEFGFDYLRDNMCVDKEDCVHRELNYAIVDEVDSILIDEARTPLIISGDPQKPTELYFQMCKVSKQLSKGEKIESKDGGDAIITGDYLVDEKSKTVTLNECGIHKVEELMGIENLYDARFMDVSHHLNQALKAKELFKRDVDYVVENGKVMIVDEFTGRILQGRRYSQGLHGALEAKENLKIETETQTLATITLQNYFRMYKKIAGMTGTAMTEKKEFMLIYGLDAIEIPTNKPCVRKDHSDVIYKTPLEKYRAVIRDCQEVHATGQPILVGTVSIETSEFLADEFRKCGMKCEVLNAKYHAKEADIVSKAGKFNQITIATNMAGRGTDIVLDEESKKAGGLFIVGTERHESRRIDNQLRGRSGRQGDNGESRFYLSLQDDLMRLFGSDRIASIMETLGLEDDQPIEHVLISRSIEHAQKRVEERNFSIRKQVLEYDDVMNKQREAIYSQRMRVLNEDNLRDSYFGFMEDLIEDQIEQYFNPELDPEEWDVETFCSRLGHFFPTVFNSENYRKMALEEIREDCIKKAYSLYESREKSIGEDLLRHMERMILLSIVDSRWKEHLAAMDSLEEGIGLRAYGQKDPLQEYKLEGFDLFEEMIGGIKYDVLELIFRMEFADQSEEAFSAPKQPENLQYHSNENASEPVRTKRKINPNSPCSCGSGKKYKKCCEGK